MCAIMRWLQKYIIDRYYHEGYVLSSTKAFLTVTVSHADSYIFSDDVDGDMETDEPENPYGGKLT